MEPNIPVGSADGRRRPAWRGRWPGAEREQREGASGKWVAHWKMVHIVRPVWERVGEDNQLGRSFPRAHLHRRRRRRTLPARAGAAHDARRPRPAQRGAPVRQRLRPRIPGGGAQAGRLLRRRRRALPDGGHGHRRDPAVASSGSGCTRTLALPRTTPRPALGPAIPSLSSYSSGCSPRSMRSCSRAGDRDVHDDSKTTTLPIAREIVEAYVARAGQAALVHRSAQPQPRQSRPRRRAPADLRVHRRLPPRATTRYRESRFQCLMPQEATR